MCNLESEVKCSCSPHNVEMEHCSCSNIPRPLLQKPNMSIQVGSLHVAVWHLVGVLQVYCQWLKYKKEGSRKECHSQ